MASRDWRAGLPAHEVEAISRTACSYADELLPCACAAGAEEPPCHHDLGCPARFRGAVATALCEARTYDRRQMRRHETTCDCDGTGLLDGEPCPFGEWKGDEPSNPTPQESEPDSPVPPAPVDPETPLRSLYKLALQALWAGAKLELSLSWQGEVTKVHLVGRDGSSATFLLAGREAEP